MSDTNTIRLERTIAAPRERVWAALTVAGRLQEWLCTRAWIETQVGGRFVFRWPTGYEAQGTILELDALKEMTWVWQGGAAAGQTLVEWQLEEEDGATEIELQHAGFALHPRGQAARAEAERGWEEALDNLQALLEEGLDRREARRPLLGVILDNLSAARVVNEGIATSTGVYVADVVAGSAAEEGGVRQGDVIVALGDVEVHDFAGLVGAMEPLQAGEVAQVGLVRGQERLVVPVTPRGRPAPPALESPDEVVARLRERQAQLRAALEEATAGLGEEEAGRPPAEGEWPVKGVLAHLSLSERALQYRIVNLTVGFDLVGGADYSAAPDHEAAVLALEPTLAGLLERLRLDQEETAQLLLHLSPATLADRFRCRQIVQLASGFVDHAMGHLDQVRAAAEAARGL